jgi:putative ATPase
LEYQMPLAARMRPERLEEFAGQQHIIGRNRLLYRAIKGDRLSSVIFYGPPGTGKTTLAKIISSETQYRFIQLNAVTAGVKEIREAASEARNLLMNPKGKVILFFDEIHRLNKGQQDVLLPYVEDGSIILIGATTENPYFEVNKALLSRSTIFRFEPLEDSDILALMERALKDEEKGLGRYSVQLQRDAASHIALISDGDARVALNALELAVLTTEPDEQGTIVIDLAAARECIQQKTLKYDKDGDNHYDIISAFIKSMRNYMEPDAVLYWLARMIESGEKPEFIARRIMICAAEDYIKEFGDEPLLKLVSKIVGLDPKAANEVFSEFLSDQNLTLQQMEFVNLIVNYIIKNGSLDKNVLNEHPFNKSGSVVKLFEDKIDIAKRIIRVIDKLNDRLSI